MNCPIGLFSSAIRVEITDDVFGNYTAELGKSVILQVSAPRNAILPGDAPTLQTVGWIIDDDGHAAPTSLVASNPVVRVGDEGRSTATFELELSRPASMDFSIDWSLDESATPGSDDKAASGVSKILKGQTLASFPVEIIGDEKPEGLALLNLRLDLPGEVASSTCEKLTILDNDDRAPGNDSLLGGAGGDRLQGERGKDKLSGGIWFGHP